MTVKYAPHPGPVTSKTDGDRHFIDGRASRVDAFLEEVIAVSKKHGLSISHEDRHGAFEIEKFSESNASWLRAALDATAA
jgi:hypothetical protein